ncbi:MAG TPA: hypothetical protein DCG32_06095 [Sphaerochaeta sp.]|jgi:hypothetical protein|nr:hypothetical protein [Sphaerochaeta sp.]
MSSLPDWVLKYKTKGIYAKKTKNGYALYRGHSERVAGKNYPVFRCDEYLGIVTEHEGLLPSRPPVKPGISVLRYGYCRVVETSCNMLRKHPKRLGLDADVLFVKAALDLEGKDYRHGYEGSWFAILFPGLDLVRDLEEAEVRYLPTLKRQVESKLMGRLGPELDEVLALSSNLYAVHVNGGWHLSDIPERLAHLAAKYAISFEIGGTHHGF